MSNNPRRMPTEFRGCIWDDGWEYDAPCVIYFPWAFRRFGIGSNSYALDSIVEEICFDIGALASIHDGGLARKCQWRGWGLRGFGRRKKAEHVVFHVKWTPDECGRMWGEIVRRTEYWGPPK